MPNAPVTPATTPHHNDERGGKGSRVSHANRSMKSKPQACAPATTRNTLARLVAMPPAKSPPPQTAAAPKLRAAPVSVPRFMRGTATPSQDSNFKLRARTPSPSSHPPEVDSLG